MDSRLICLFATLGVVCMASISREEREQYESERRNIFKEKHCRFNIDHKYHVSLTKLVRHRPPDYIYQKENSADKYFFNMCHPTIMTCNGEEDALVAQFNEGECKKVLARGRQRYARFIEPTNRTRGFEIGYSGGDKCENGKEASVKFVVNCDPAIENGVETLDVFSDDGCDYFFDIRTKQGCQVHESKAEVMKAEEELFDNRMSMEYDMRKGKISEKHKKFAHGMTFFRLVVYVLFCFILCNMCGCLYNMCYHP